MIIPTVQMHTIGGLTSIAVPHPRNWAPKRIAASLAKINRYNGQTKLPWSVAAHSILVSRICRNTEGQAWGLLHDAHEVILGDLVDPVVDYLETLSGGAAHGLIQHCIRLAKSNLDAQINKAWDVQPCSLFEVKNADALARSVEKFLFFGDAQAKQDNEGFDRAYGLLTELEHLQDWTLAESAWLSEVAKLSALGAFKPPYFGETSPPLNNQKDLSHERPC